MTNFKKHCYLCVYTIIKKFHWPVYLPWPSCNSVDKKIWTATFFLRGWVNWTLDSKNFVTQNAFECVEINAHKLLGQKWVIYFLPLLCNSQACESFFRHKRATTSTQLAIINFSMYDFIHKVKRIQCQNRLKCNPYLNLQYSAAPWKN